MRIKDIIEARMNKGSPNIFNRHMFGKTSGQRRVNHLDCERRDDNVTHSG